MNTSQKLNIHFIHPLHCVVCVWLHKPPPNTHTHMTECFTSTSDKMIKVLLNCVQDMRHLALLGQDSLQQWNSLVPPDHTTHIRIRTCYTCNMQQTYSTVHVTSTQRNPLPYLSNGSEEAPSDTSPLSWLIAEGASIPPGCQ